MQLLTCDVLPPGTWLVMGCSEATACWAVALE
jgi:hypothetical protein